MLFIAYGVNVCIQLDTWEKEWIGKEDGGEWDEVNKLIQLLTRMVE